MGRKAQRFLAEVTWSLRLVGQDCHDVLRLERRTNSVADRLPPIGGHDLDLEPKAIANELEELA
jgi:hypothetical protein